MKKFIWALTLCFACCFGTKANADLIIAAVVDGTQTGGNPKALRIEATADIMDLSDFWILRDTNGSTDGTFMQSDEFQLPSISLALGDSFIIYGNTVSEDFGDSQGNIIPGVVDAILNHNGDDILVVSSSSTIADAIDAYGLVGQDDTDFAQNSVSVRNGSTAIASGVQDAGNFTISDYTDQLYIDNFVLAVPEPTSAMLFGLAGLGLCVVRRRS